MFAVQQTLFATDYQPPADYMIGIYPNGEIAGEVMAFRQLLAQQIGAFAGQDHTPHLILMAFTMMRDAEEELLRKLDDFSFKRLRSSNVELSGFTCADESKSVLIEPRQMTYLSSIVRKVSTLVKPIGKSKPKPIKHSGAMAVASGLTSEKFKAAQELFNNKVYARICFANNLVLLRSGGEAQAPVSLKSFSLL